MFHQRKTVFVRQWTCILSKDRRETKKAAYCSERKKRDYLFIELFQLNFFDFVNKLDSFVKSQQNLRSVLFHLYNPLIAQLCTPRLVDEIRRKRCFVHLEQVRKAQHFRFVDCDVIARPRDAFTNEFLPDERSQEQNLSGK